MSNFYYVVTFNLHHPIVSSLLKRITFLDLSDNIVALKTRSSGFSDPLVAHNKAFADFERKVECIFVDKDDYYIQAITIGNPDHAEFLESLDQELFDSMLIDEDQAHLWNENCLFTSFLCHANADLIEDNDQVISNPGDVSDWMFKYEVFASEIGVEQLENGESEFAVAFPDTSSTYH